MNRVTQFGYAFIAAALVAGCAGKSSKPTAQVKSEPAPAATPAVPASRVTAVPATPGVIRINAGVSASVTDSAGNVWLADQGFEGGDVVDRGDLEITGTKNQVLYRTERYSMDSFSWPLPNGKYQVRLHFAETFEGITGPGERVFSLNVQGKEFKDFDVWKRAGGALKAYVETVDVEVTDGKLAIKFTPNIENPEINAVEIIPAG